MRVLRIAVVLLVLAALVAGCSEGPTSSERTVWGRGPAGCDSTIVGDCG